jgi:drug/metabolite transporter (DMT)-like permease
MLKLKDNKSVTAISGTLAAYVIFGLSFIFSKVALNQVSPFVLLALRFLCAFTLLNLLLLTGKFRLKLKGKRLWPLLLIGFLQPVAYFIFESYGIKLTTATFSSVVVSLIPIATLLGGILFLREIPKKLQVVSMLVSVGGVVTMALLQNSDGTVKLAGIFMMIGAVAAAAVFNGLTRKFSGEFSAFERTYVMFLLGTVVFLPLAIVQSGGSLTAVFAALGYKEVLWAVLFLGVLSSVVAFLLLNDASAYLPVARTSAFSNITTVVSVAAGVVYLKESFSAVTVLAVAAIIAGVWGVQRFRGDREKASRN